MGPKAKEQLLVDVKSSLRQFKSGQELFLHLHASGKYWEKESYIVWAIQQTSLKHYETISRQIIQKFPISSAASTSTINPSKVKKKRQSKPEMKLYDLPDRRMLYIGKFKQ